MTAADVIRMLLEMDQQVMSGRPSAVGRAAEIVQELCRHAEGSLRNPQLLGDFESIDLSPARAKRVGGELWQPTMALAEENDKLRDDLEHAKTCIEILNVAPKTLVHRPGGTWDVFEDGHEAARFERDERAKGNRLEAFNVSRWNLHISRDGKLPGTLDTERLDWLESCDMDDFQSVYFDWQRGRRGDRLRGVIDRVRGES